MNNIDKVKKVPDTEAICFGWEATKKNLGLLIGVMLIAGIINIAPNSLRKMIGEEAAFLAILIGVLGWVAQVIIDMGLIRIGLKFCDNQKAEFNNLFQVNGTLLLNYIVGSIIYGVIVGVGFLLLIVPGIIWAIKFQFFGYYIVDKGMGPIEALKRSAQTTSGAKGELFIFVLLLGLINVAGMLALLVGLFVALPVTLVAYSYVYRKLEVALGDASLPEKFDLSFK